MALSLVHLHVGSEANSIKGGARGIMRDTGCSRSEWHCQNQAMLYWIVYTAALDAIERTRTIGA